ncbi:hypothetical protein BDY17DRAFT_109633 [Neohortaea acidophila]|uniref:Uncharacterized protein n=1 Tax=Neohortaea acidophila TaxID=245834 RepID=A0A6A6Q0Y4_9PEZI|nr:uncharacterized protein BDY17DRAFT_109633 [Neohortaea acidophila]KAF2485654.1 hypothetical protein BDY17DRAFT_109633 [Neohortaea acidophila]
MMRPLNEHAHCNCVSIDAYCRIKCISMQVTDLTRTSQRHLPPQPRSFLLNSSHPPDVTCQFAAQVCLSACNFTSAFSSCSLLSSLLFGSFFALHPKLLSLPTSVGKQCCSCSPCPRLLPDMDDTDRENQPPNAATPLTFPPLDIRETSPLEFPPLQIVPESALRSTVNSGPAANAPAPTRHAPTPTQVAKPPVDQSMPPPPLPAHIRQRTAPNEFRPGPPPTRKPYPLNDTDFVANPFAPPQPPPAAPVYEEDEVHVDTDDGQDGVYFVNADAQSWAASLPEEDDPAVQADIPWQAVLAVQRNQHEQQLAAQVAAVAATSANDTLQGSAPAWPEIPDHLAQWRDDLLIRNVVRQIKRRLQRGAEFTFQIRFPWGAADVTCAHPYCRAARRIVPLGGYYVELGRDGQPPDYYCLLCVEGMWNGEGMKEPLPDPQVNVQQAGLEQATAVFNLDGDLPNKSDLDEPARPRPQIRIPQSLLSSKHAPSYEELLAAEQEEEERPRSITPRYSPETLQPMSPTPRSGSITPVYSAPTPGSEHASPEGTTGDSEAERPPTQFQHLAKFMKAGESLNDDEKAAFELWKAVSVEQIFWIDFHAKYAATMSQYNVATGDRIDSPEVTTRIVFTARERAEVEVAPATDASEGEADTESDAHMSGEDGKPPVIVESVTSSTGVVLSRQQCEGSDLSEVLKMFLGGQRD